MSQQKCPDGRYSLGGASSCLICPAGQSCINGSDPISPTECHRGTYSPPGVGICHACPLGTYSNTGASFCSPCPAGHSCNDPSQTPVACTSSEYWNNGGEVSSLKLLKFLKAKTGTKSSSNISLGFWLLRVFQHTQNKWLGFDLVYNKRLRISSTILLQHLNTCVLGAKKGMCDCSVFCNVVLLYKLFIWLYITDPTMCSMSCWLQLYQCDSASSALYARLLLTSRKCIVYRM